jgi:bile acid:Na+ symporter, BASS family
MVANLAAAGLVIEVRELVAPLRNTRLLAITLLANLMFAPAVAYMIAAVFPMSRGYGMGILLLGLAAGGPFTPIVARIAGGDLAYSCQLLFLGSVGTVFLMLVAPPWMLPGVEASTASIVKLLLLVILPMALGMLIKHRFSRAARRVYPFVKAVAGVSTIVLLVLLVVLHFKAVLGAIGSGAIAALILFTGITMAGAYVLGAGQRPEQRSVLCLGTAGRNIAAAAVPLAGTAPAPKALVMLVLYTFVGLAMAMFAARMFAQRTRAASQVENPCEA